MAIRSIYNTRWPKHPHSPIRRYERHPQGLATRTCYIESCPTRPAICLRLHIRLRLKYHTVSILPQTSSARLLRWDLANRRISYPSPRALSLASAIPHDSTVPNWFNCLFLSRFNSLVPELIWLKGSELGLLFISDSIWLFFSFLIWPIVSELIHLKIFDWIRISFFGLIWLTSYVFIFDSSHVIWVPLQSGFRESHIGQGVFKIIQHWNCEIFHYSENSIWLWHGHSKIRKIQRRETKI